MTLRAPACSSSQPTTPTDGPARPPDSQNEPGHASLNLPEVDVRGKEHRRIQYAVLTAFAVHGGLEPDPLDEVTHWIEQYWQYALFAAVAIVRACADRSGTPLETFVADLAARHAIDIN
jgi:hypothetical protein